MTVLTKRWCSGCLDAHPLADFDEPGEPCRAWTTSLREREQRRQDELITYGKRCVRCRLQLPLDAYGPHPRGVGGRQPACKSCEVERMAMRRHGMTTLEKHEQAQAQEGCAICGTTEPGSKGWMMDHDHACCPGEVSCAACRRGVLCGGCNRLLGLVGDDADRLRRAALYLELGTRSAWVRP